jgi:predicted DNA-binding transcriptional regulator AlpA
MSTTTLDNVTLLSDSGLAEMLGVSVRTIDRLNKRPGFPRPLKIGRCRRWARDEVLAFFRGESAAENMAACGR